MQEFDQKHFLRKIEVLEERQQRQALEVSEGFSAIKSLTEENKRIAEEASKDVDGLVHWMNGLGDRGGAKVRLALLEEREKRRDWWVKTAISMAVSCLIAVFVVLIRTFASGVSG